MSILHANAFFVGAALIACLAACSQNDTVHPPSIGDCQGTAAQCGVGPGTNGNLPTGGNGGDASTDGGTGGTACGNLSSPVPDCEACLEQTCCTPAITCSNNAECFALTNCLRSCQPTDQPCITGCQNLHITGLPAYNGYISCLQTSCSIPCGLVDGGTSCGQFVFSSPACDTCVTTNCCGPANVCSNDPDCFSLGQCLQTCLPTDTVCQTNCRTLLPAGTGTYAALGLCISSNCTAQCQ